MPPGPWCTGTRGKAQAGRHLEVSVHDAQAVQVGDSAEDLAHQVAGVLLCVGAALHDAIKQLAPGHPGGSGGSAGPGPGPQPVTQPPAQPDLPSSQLHGQVEVGRALVDILQSHDVGVADPAGARQSPLRAGPAPSGPPGKPFALFFPSHPGPLPWHRPPPQGRAPGQAFPGTPRRQGAPRRRLGAHLRSTAISFSTRASLPRRAFLGMHLRATRCEEPRSCASTTSEKAPLRRRGRQGGRGRGEERGRESRGGEGEQRGGGAPPS